MDRLLTPSEAAELLNVRERTIRRWIFLRKIEFVKVGNRVRIPGREIQRVIDEGRVRRISNVGNDRR